MSFLIAFFIGLLVVGNVNETSNNKNNSSKKEIVQVQAKPEPVQKEFKLEPVQEEVKPTNSIEKTSWLKIIFYILGSVFILGTGTYYYGRKRNRLSPKNPTDFMRSEFKEEVEPESTEQQSSQDEVEPESTEQQSSQDEVEPESTEQQSSQDEVEPESTEQQPVEKEPNKEK